MNYEVMAAIGEPNRYRIIELLRTGPRPVNEICERLHLRQSQVSQHLKVLKEARLVAVEPRAQQRLYGLHGPSLKQLHIWLDRYRRIWDERFEQLDELARELEQGQMPSRKAQMRTK
jgi:DNA-binding transcriptional ArsR family regulator